MIRRPPEFTRQTPPFPYPPLARSVNKGARPGGDGKRLYQMPEGEKLDLLRRPTAAKPVAAGPAPPADTPADNNDNEPAPKPLEDWWLVRNPHKQVGWV